MSRARSYYNDNEPHIATWLRNLTQAGHLPAGYIDTRSIADVQPSDIEPYTQAHFFAGIGGWPLALALAGWPTDRPVWTGSCPCQPFSQAGKRRGTSDTRHLWPEFRRLIDKCRPATIFGEQVASPDGRRWLSGVRADLEAMGYAVGAADLCAAGVAAPHIRQRLYWVAHRSSVGQRQIGAHPRGGATGSDEEKRPAGLAMCGPTARVAHAQNADGRGIDTGTRGARGRGSTSSSPTARSWSSAEFITDTRGVTRRIEPGIAPLAHGIPRGLVALRTGEMIRRSVAIRGYGNAIVPQVAAEFIQIFLDIPREI